MYKISMLLLCTRHRYIHISKLLSGLLLLQLLRKAEGLNNISFACYDKQLTVSWLKYVILD